MIRCQDPIMPGTSYTTWTTCRADKKDVNALTAFFFQDLHTRNGCRVGPKEHYTTQNLYQVFGDPPNMFVIF